MSDENLSSSITESLNDDCLAHIIKYLSFHDRLRIEQVCKRWNCISQSSWKTFNYLDLSKGSSTLKLFYNEQDVLKKNFLFFKILSRCGEFIKFVNISYLKNLDLIVVLRMLTKFCENIISLKLTWKHPKKRDITNNEQFYDDHLKYLIKKNVNLKFLKLGGLTISESCLLSLSIDSLETISLNDCYFVDTKVKLHHLPNLKNLNTLKLKWCFTSETVEPMIDVFLTNNCLNLKKFILYSTIEHDLSNSFSHFFPKMKNLSHLKLQYPNINKEILSNLPFNSIEIIDINAEGLTAEDFIIYLPNFQKLSKLNFVFNKLDDQYAEALCSCKNLKHLHLPRNSVSLSHLGESYFSKLQNLQEINVSDNPKITDQFLIAISHCKNLIQLNISYCYKISDKGIKELSTLEELKTLKIRGLHRVTDKFLQFSPKLKQLDCSDCPKIKNSGLCELIKNSQNLEFISVCYCKDITNEVIDIAIETKNTKLNYRILKIYTFRSGIENDKIINTCPYVQIMHDIDSLRIKY